MRVIPISKANYEYRESGDRVSWLDEFAEKIERAARAVDKERTAVDVARERSAQSYVDQIRSIMNHSQQFKTVESVVQDMQERVGLKAYLSKLEAGNTDKPKVANEKPFESINDDLKNDVINFINNKVKTHRGRIHVPAVQDEILTLFKNKGIKSEDVDTKAAAKYINDVIVSELNKNPNMDNNSVDLGRGVGIDIEEDAANTDFFHGMTPQNKGVS